MHSNCFFQLSVFKNNPIRFNKSNCFHKFFSTLLPFFLCRILSVFSSLILFHLQLFSFTLIQSFTGSTCVFPHLVQSAVLGSWRIQTLRHGFCLGTTLFEMRHVYLVHSSERCKSHLWGIKTCGRSSEGEIFYSCGDGKQMKSSFFHSLVISVFPGYTLYTV